jgi:hypothetical protein
VFCTGVLETPVGTYTGEFVENKMHGKGKFTYKDGSVYVGGFAEGLKHGKGKLSHKDGSGLEGNFMVRSNVGYPPCGLIWTKLIWNWS